ncbi:hypothetical protein GIB67_010409, partial [Kingdonia uniflora]
MRRSIGIRTFVNVFRILVQLTVLTVYIFLYGKTYLPGLSIVDEFARLLRSHHNNKNFLFQALSGAGESIQEKADVLQNTALSAALNTQFLLQIGIFTAVPMILGFILEQGFLR